MKNSGINEQAWTTYVDRHALAAATDSNCDSLFSEIVGIQGRPAWLNTFMRLLDDRTIADSHQTWLMSALCKQPQVSCLPMLRRKIAASTHQDGLFWSADVLFSINDRYGRTGPDAARVRAECRALCQSALARDLSEAVKRRFTNVLGSIGQ